MTALKIAGSIRKYQDDGIFMFRYGAKFYLYYPNYNARQASIIDAKGYIRNVKGSSMKSLQI